MDVNKLIFEMFKDIRRGSIAKLRKQCDKLGCDYGIVTNMLIDYQTKKFGNYGFVGDTSLCGKESVKQRRRNHSRKTEIANKEYMRKYNEQKRILKRMENNGTGL